MKEETESLFSRWWSLLRHEPKQAAKLGAVLESALCMAFSLMAFAVIFGLPITSITIVVSFMLAVIGFVGSLGIGFESGIGYWRNHVPRWKNQLTASIVGLMLGAIGIYVNVSHILDLFAV